MRTAEIVIVDELRAFHADLLGELVDRMAAYGGRGRLITASSAGYEDECRTTTELDKSDSAPMVLYAARRATARTSPTGKMLSTRAARIPCTPCRAAVPSLGA